MDKLISLYKDRGWVRPQGGPAPFIILNPEIKGTVWERNERSEAGDAHF